MRRRVEISVAAELLIVATILVAVEWTMLRLSAANRSTVNLIVGRGLRWICVSRWSCPANLAVRADLRGVDFRAAHLPAAVANVEARPAVADRGQARQAAVAGMPRVVAATTVHRHREAVITARTGKHN